MKLKYAISSLAGVLMTVNAAGAGTLSDTQVEAVAAFWDLAYDCADGSSSCELIAPAVREMNRLGICPDENRLTDCASIGVQSEAAPERETEAPAPPTAMVSVPAAPAGLATINPEWHEAIAADQCLTETGFDACKAYTPPRLASNGTLYEGITADETRLLTRWIIYVEECRGAAGQANIDGWCAARDAARDSLQGIGLCLFDFGFRSCRIAGSMPESVPFDDAVVRAAFEELPAGQRRYIQQILSAGTGGADGVYGPRTARALHEAAKDLEILTMRDPTPERFDLSSDAGARAYLSFLQEPLTEAILWGAT